LIRLLAFFIIVTISIPAAHSQATKTVWTLEECLKYSIKNNIAVNQADLNQKVSKNNYIQSKIALLPSVSTNLSYSFSFGYSIDPTNYSYVKQNSQSFLPTGQANLNLFTGLQQINTIKKDKYDLAGYNGDYLNAINTTALNVTNLFLQIVLDKELVKAAEKQVSISQSQLDVTQAKIKAGTLAETAVYDFEAQLARDQATLISQKNSVEIAVLALQIALQLPDQQAFDISVPDINIASVMTFDKLDVNDIYHYALKNQPSVKAAQARVKSALYSIKIARGAMSPTFSVTYNTRDNYFNQPSYSYTNGQLVYSLPSFAEQFKQNISNSISFNASIPIFSNWQRMTNIANAKLQYKIQELNVDNANNNLRRDVYQAYANARGNAETYVANLKALESQRMAYQAAQRRYDAGLAAAFELEQSRDNLAKTESNAIQAKYNYIFSVKVLDYYQGIAITLN
jgi:outer membrane protein